MRFNLKYIFPSLFLVSNHILYGSAHFLFQDNQNLKGIIQKRQDASNVTEEQLNSFTYGAKEFKLGIIGDSGSEYEAKEVMRLTDYDALLHLGDFDYDCKADKYFDNILDSKRSYEFMGVLGNHEALGECSSDIQKKFLNNVVREMEKNKKIKCEFSSSKFMWTCIYENIRIIGITPGIKGADDRKKQLSFLRKSLKEAKEDWKICSFHYYDNYFHTGKYQTDYNFASGENESFYDKCREYGAIIFSAHDHVYARSRVMTKFKTPKIDSHDKDTSEDIVQIRNGATVNLLNGAGGYEIYIEQGEQMNYPHWQKKYAKGSHNENAKKFGGLFCQFNYGGNNRKAYCEFLRINSSNKVFDTFYIYRNDDPSSVTYEQIDTAFKNEKLYAYKLANNVPVDDSLKDTVEHDKNMFSSDKSGFKLFKGKNLMITVAACALIALLCGGLLVIKKFKNERQTKEKDLPFDSEDSEDDNKTKEERKSLNRKTFSDLYKYGYKDYENNNDNNNNNNLNNTKKYDNDNSDINKDDSNISDYYISLPIPKLDDGEFNIDITNYLSNDDNKRTNHHDSTVSQEHKSKDYFYQMK